MRRLKALRIHRGYSQRYLAALTRFVVRQPIISDIEAGRCNPTKDELDALARVFACDAETTAHLEAEKTRLTQEIQNLVTSIAAGVPADTVGPAIQERQREIGRLDAKLRQPRPVQPTIDELCAALEQRAATWRETLRAEPTVARLLLRRLIGPLTMWDPTDPGEAWSEWEAALTPALLEGLVAIQVVASPTGFEPVFWP